MGNKSKRKQVRVIHRNLETDEKWVEHRDIGYRRRKKNGRYREVSTVSARDEKRKATFSLSL